MTDETPSLDAKTNPRISWYRCHSCGWEAWIADGVRSSFGCGNAKCYHPDLHVHSNADGEMPKTLGIL